MRSISAILLLSIFLTYHLGYYGVYIIVEHQINSQWKEKILEDQLDMSALKTVSTPFSLPYRPDQVDYQPTFGLFKIDGEFYRFVKYRYAMDTLHLVYAKDRKMESLYGSLRDWAVTFTTIPVSKSGNVEWWKSMCKDFLMSLFAKEVYDRPLYAQKKYSKGLLFVYSFFIEVPSPPPKTT
ncbi:hypothetical protein [Fulvivirga imtechensis]|uniref:hypothetical protein n=1 Tax=Fulvivirga imtechensis TaxID=881893 RepID=UPI0003046896|nr:hypothetical protein [Fulvivirga imtechensis]